MITNVKRACVVTAIAIGVASAAACDDDRTPQGVGVVRTDLAAAFVSVQQPVVTIAPFGPCFAIGFAQSLNLAITAGSSDVSLDHVTIQLLDGSNVGGPSITFPRAGLNSQFGSTVVRQRASRTFGLTPSFGCTPTQPQFIRADVQLIDQFGASQSLRSTVSLH